MPGLDPAEQSAGFRALSQTARLLAGSHHESLPAPRAGRGHLAALEPACRVLDALPPNDMRQISAAYAALARAARKDARMVDLRTLFGDARTNIRSAGAGPAPATTTREQEPVQIERAAAALPSEGPLFQIVGALDAVLIALRQLDAASPAAWAGTHLDPFCEHGAYALRVSPFRLGQHTHRLTSSIETMRAIHHKAATMAEDAGVAEYRRDVLEKAWAGIGEEHGTWIA